MSLLEKLQKNMRETTANMPALTVYGVRRSTGNLYSKKWLVTRNGEIVAAFDYSAGVEAWLDYCRNIGRITTPTKSQCSYRRSEKHA